MKKKSTRLISAILSAAMALTSIPFSAFAEGEVHTHSGTGEAITTPLDFREKTADENGDGWIWDYDTKTLTLDGVNIQATTEGMSVVTVPDGTEIVLKGENTIIQTDTGDSYTYVLSAVNKDDVNCDGTMTISGDGVLNAENRSTSTMTRSLGGTIIINGGTVNATGKVSANSIEIHNDGVLNANASAVSNDGAAVEVGRGITVDGNGSLTAVGSAVEDEYANNGAILLSSNFGDKISVSGNGSITVPESNKARGGIYYSTNTSIDAEISGGKVTAYGTKCGIYKINLTMSGSGSVYATGDTRGISNTYPSIDEDEFVIKGSTEFKAEESAVTDKVEFNGGYYEIDGADAKTVVIKPNTEPSIKLGKQIGAVYMTEDDSEYGSLYITAKNFAEGEFKPEVEWIDYHPAGLSAEINSSNTVCDIICEAENISGTYELRIKSGDVYSNTVTVAVGKPHMAIVADSKVAKNVYYTNYNADDDHEKQKLAVKYAVDETHQATESIEYKWSSASNKYNIDDLGTVNAEDGANEFVFNDNVPEGSYVIYCDVILSDESGEGAYTLTERFAFTFEECKHTAGFTNGICNTCNNSCEHKDVDTDSGRCAICGKSFSAVITKDGKNSVYNDMAPAFADAGKDENKGCTLKMYTDYYPGVNIELSGEYTLDMNGNRIGNSTSTIIKENAVITVKGKSVKSITTFDVANGGTLVLDKDYNGVPGIWMGGGKLIAYGGEIGSLLIYEDSDITFCGGKVDIISTQATEFVLASLLADGYAFVDGDSNNFVNAYGITISSSSYNKMLVSVTHECSYDKDSTTGKCKECGKPCPHDGEINAEDGTCSTCGKECGAVVIKADGTVVGYDDLTAAFAEAGNNNDCTLKLFSTYEPSEVIEVSGKFTIDLNGKQCLNSKNIIIGKNAIISLTGNGNSSYISKFKVAGGTLTVSADYNGSIDSITVQDGKLDLYSGSVESVHIEAGADIALYGGYISGVFNDTGDTENPILLRSLLADGYAFATKDDSGTLTVTNKYDSTISSFENINLYVVEHKTCSYDKDNPTGVCKECGKPCKHDIDISMDDGVCVTCGMVVPVALYTDANGNLYNVDTDGLHNILTNYYGSGTIKLFKDYSKSSAKYDLYGELTIDVNGHKLSVWSITPCNSGKLTIKNSGDPVTFCCNPSPTNDASYRGGTLIIDGDIILDTAIYVYDSSTVILNAGTYPAGLYARDSKTLYDMLGEGKAFFKADGTLFNANVKEVTTADGALKIDAHPEHTYNSNGECGCGYVCPHDEVDVDTGMCTECEYQYAAVIVKDGAIDSVYKDTEMVAAFSAADSDANKGCTLKLFKNYTGGDLILSGEFTLWIADEVSVGTVTVFGDITVTGSGKNNSTYGDFNVEGGVGKLTFDENCGANGTVTVVFGTFDCYRSLGTTLNINDLSSNVILHGGSFTAINYSGGGDRGNDEILTLLADNRAFFVSGELQDVSGKTLLDGISNVTVSEHSHDYKSETGKCACGKTCDHTNVDSKTGICGDCGYQLTAIISGVETPSYYGNIDDAFAAAVSEENNGCTLTLYKNCELSQVTEIRNATVTVDVNGYSLGGIYAEIDVIDDGVMYLKDSRKSTYNGIINTPVVVNGGTLINGSADGSSSAVDIYQLGVQRAESVEIYGGRCETLFIENASGIALYGGSYGLIHGNENVTNTPVSNLLAKGYAFATLNEVTNLPEKIVDGSTTMIGGTLENVVVLEHTHTYTETNTKCACGAVLYAKVTTADGTVEKFDNIEEGLLYANKAENKGCVFTVVTTGGLENDITLSSGQFTIAAIDDNYIDAYTRKINIKGAEITVENCAFNCFIALYSGSLTYPEGSTSVCINGINVYGGTLNISDGVSENCGANHFTISSTATDAKVTIGGGTFNEINLGQYTLKDVLASGTRLISIEYSQDTDEIIATNELLYSEVSGLSTFGTDDDKDYRFVKCDHKNDDGSYALDSGVCKYCNLTFAASVSYTTDDGEKTELFADIFGAFDKANEVGTATVTLQKNITGTLSRAVESAGENITLDLNGKKLIANYDGVYTVDVKSGKLTVIGEGQSALNYVTVYDGANAEIQGGVYTSLKVNDGGNAELKGGRFGGVSVSGEGRTLEDLLAYGYGYMNFMDVTWVTVANREKQTIANVTIKEAPIKSVSLAWHGEATAVIYRNGSQGIYLDVTAVSDVDTQQLSYSDFVNGNAVSSNMYPGYLFGTLLDLGIDLQNNIGNLNVADSSVPDGEVEYYCIFKYNGYEYKTNSLTFTLATCSHPEESLTERNGGDHVKCGICGALMKAQVNTADGETIYRGEMNEAIKTAQANEGSTLVLISGRVGGDVIVDSGKFTIDINGTDLCYNFNIQGGEVTLTSPTAYPSACSSRLYVSGNDAKVTIDGKVKLGDVYILQGGTLTINSTDAYIKNLSTQGGKTDIDGAEIESLVFKGGDLAIRNITVGSLDINKKVTDASAHNIVIESGSFDTITCSDDSGYNIVKALASGSRVRYKGETAYDYERVMDWTEGSNLVFEVCDHKNDGGYPELNDANVCYYCNSQIVAIVSYTIDDVSDKRDPFSDICDAFAKANEVGTATITLYKDIENSELTRDITVTGDVTLELNGHNLMSGYNMKTITVDDGGKLTVNGDGDMEMSINVNKNSKLVINGGGYIYSVTVNKEGNAEIGGGNIEYLAVSGNAKLSGGKFDLIDIFNGNLESVLADGYAYKKDGGAWLSIAERAKENYSTSRDGNGKKAIVEKAPIKSASIAWADGEMPVAYRNGAKYLDVNVTYELADRSKEITYSDFVNGNNRMDDSVLYNDYYMVPAHEIGKIVTEDVEAEYYTVFKCDGYEYKSNTLKLTLATCSHPEDSLTDKNGDGRIFCGICDLSIAAKVTAADGKLLGYADIDSALKLAQENEGSTVKLMKERGTDTPCITVTDSRFTVDFNGKEVCYTFVVIGGDVTFISSAEQADVQDLKSEIQVCGADAKVTIDGKIKLGTVAVASGTLTVNSTEAYIENLSTLGGKVTVDGALINEITINGGESVIKVTDSLENNNAGTTLVLNSSETEYSVSIEGGYFSSVTCEDGSGYTLGKALAKGTTVMDDAGKSYKYSDISESTGISYVFVKKCLHIEDDASNRIALDSSGRCIYCNNEYVATVNYIGSDGSERIDLFENVLAAFDKANEVGTATVKLYKDITDSDLTNNEDSDLIRNIIITGDVTLELNGKILGDIVSSSRIYIYNGGALTVNGDGRIPANIYTNPGSKITVNSGYCDYITADGNVIICGGTINRLDIYGDAEISGGTFKFLTIDNGGDTLDSVLVDGYAYYNVDDEKWLTVAEREEKAINGDIVTVKKAPIKSARIAWQNGESPVIYRNGMQSVTVDVAKELAGDLQVSYSDFVNGIELTADSLLGVDFTTISGADVDACGIPDGEVEYYCIFTCDGYEYKSNVLNFTLATCLHENLTNVDGVVTCDECGYCLIAQVETADGEVTYYDDIAKATTAAAENEGSTLTLVSRTIADEYITISGGKFTVDLAGVSALYKFNITGGDVTFKSSEEFGSSDRCNITVKGYSAKVTIDGKIELEAVELSGGTFTTNSTEAYINDLSIYGGKADIDGAYIRTITINGGDTVIKDVIAHSLSMVGSRFGNLSIVSGRFHIVTFFGYTLGKAIASGSRVIGHDMSGVILYKYADIQSKTEIDSIVVEKCDHKDKYGSYVLDGNPCPYCNEEIVATVSYTADGSEKTEPFSDVCDAFGKANEAGTATVTLYKDNSDGLTRAIHVTGNVTLELNGHDLSITYYTSTITVDDGGTLTVNGGENDELLIVEGLSGSKIIVNGGSLSTLIAEGDAELAGGSFGDIVCAEGITVDSLLAPGYAYKNSDGTWVSIADRENTSISNVTVTEAPVLSVELTADKTKVYRNGTGKVTFGIKAEMRDGNTVSDDNPLSGQGHTTRTVFGTEQLSSTVSISGEASCSYLGMLVNDGEVVEVYYIVKYDGYELRTNTVTIEVDTCYHPADKVVSSANGNLVCGECESIIYAEIINGDSTKCYTDFEEAMEDAQLEENEGCTVMVTSDTSGINYITLYSGQFTLDLAGHKVEFIEDRIITTTGADVTIKDSFGGGIIRSGEGIARVITAQNDGKVTLEGGTIANNVYISSGKLDMCGATVENTVEIGANAKEVTIRDGSVIKGTLDVYANADPTHIKLSGGWYAYADVECSDFAKVLVKDKRLLKDSGGYYSYSELCDSTCKPENFTIVDCDHKGADGSIALDSSYACKYCGTKFVARVSYAADGTIVDEYFDNINEAFDKAKTINDNSIIKILNNVDGKLDKPITVTGKISLDFYKGKGISAVSDDGRSITVADGGSLEICSSGSVKNIVVENGAKLSINNGTFESVTVYGEVTLLGGTYGKLETNAEGGVASLLMYGYGYKNADGTWLTVAEREADSAENVTIADVPLNDATLSVDTNTLYRNSNNDPTVKFNIIIDSAANVFDGVTGVTIESRCVVNSNEAESKNWDLRYPNYNDTLNSSEILTLAGDSDVAEVYFIVTYDGYEVKTNTVSIDLVDCEHPSASIVDPITDEDTNGNITNPTYCEICKNQFHAKIVNGDSVKYYNDLYEAVADAQKSENEGCTLYPLYDANGYKEQIVISGGKFTFRVLARVYISKPVIIKGDADITILGRALVSNGADNTAVIVESGNVDFAGLATSDVIINGGNVTMSAINVRHLTINGGNVSIASGQFAQIDVTTEGKVIADYIVPGNWVQDGKTNEWIDIYHLTSATETAESIGLRVRMCPMSITQPDDTVYYTNGYYPNGIPSLEVGAMALYTAEVNPAIAYQWFSVDENGNETAIDGATGKTLSLANLTTGKYYCRITYSNATTAGVSVKSDIVTATITECKHTGGEADCTNKAVCEICHAEYGDLLPHNYELIKDSKYLKSPADCTNAAVYYLVCTMCGKSSAFIDPTVTQVVGDPLGHKYGAWVSNGNGTHTRVCANDSKHTETADCHGGTATCTAKAKCADCGAEYGEMTAHTFTAKTATTKYLKTAATCTQKSEYYVSCADCGLSSKGTASEATFTGSALGHSLTAWSVTTEATCTADGSQERHCTRCDYKQTKTIAAKGHSYSQWKVTKEASCITDGEQSRECSVCGNKETQIIAATRVHSYGNWKVTKAATCTTTGIKERTCSGCGAKETVVIQATGHKYVESIVEPTYTEKGYTLHKCSVCGNSYKTAYTDKLVLAAVTGVTLGGTAGDALRINWNKNASADGYIIEIYKDGAWSRAGKITTNSTVTFRAEGLKASTVYKFRVKAYKMSGSTAVYSAYSTTVTAMTNPSVMTGIKLVGRAADALHINWTKNASADGYIIEIYKDGAWSRAGKITNNSTAGLRVSGLKSSTVYKLRVRAYKMSGTVAYYGAYSTVVTAMTNPSAMTGAKLSGRAADALHISWTKNASADGYIVEIYKDGAWSRAGKITNNSTTGFRVAGLKPSTVYKLRVRAYKMSGTVAHYGAYSDMITERTNPSAMTRVKIGGTAKDALRINWNKNTSAQGYIVEMAQDGKWVRVAKITDTGTTTFRKAGLVKNTSYRFRVCAYYMSGSTPLYGTYVSVSGKTEAD